MSICITIDSILTSPHIVLTPIIPPLLSLFFPFLFAPFPLSSFRFLNPPTISYHDTENMRHRSPSATSPRRYILLSLLVMILDSLVSAGAGGGLSRTVQTPISTVVAPLDAAAMETLCADQIGMCTVSCQSKIQQNSWYIPNHHQKKKKKNVHAPSFSFFFHRRTFFPSYLTFPFFGISLATRKH